jgi:soluble cytochrome b562
MTTRLPIRPLALCSLLACAAIAVSWSRPPASVVITSAPAVSVDDLEEIMESLDKNFEAVLASIEKKEAAPALELTTKMQQACISAKTLTPPKLRTVEEKDKAAFVAGYRKQILTLLKATADLEIALVDGVFVQAKKVADEIDAMQSSGHDTYKKMPRNKPAK